VVWLEPPVSACRPFAGSLEPIGAALGLPVPQIGRLSLEVDVSGGSVTRVRIGGAAVTVLRGVIRVP
jgi:predicted PhzF superfamily epimerase YddE/YHI9